MEGSLLAFVGCMGCDEDLGDAGDAIGYLDW